MLKLLKHTAALGALKNSFADVSVAITGVAGPTGGNEKTPVGMVYFAFAYKNKIKSMCKYFAGTQRNDIRAKAVEFALQELIKFVVAI
jgi:nicotinamide-nucleotide amidase